jgi:hypothetical protein
MTIESRDFVDLKRPWLNTYDIYQDQLLVQAYIDFGIILMPSINILHNYIALRLVSNLAATAARPVMIITASELGRLPARDTTSSNSRTRVSARL